MIDRSKAIPLYVQLKQIILNRIEKGIYGISDSIPSEVELQKNFNVSRITVRRAIMELEREGYLEKIPGRGTFVKSSEGKEEIIQDLDNITTWTETMKKEGYKPGTSKIEIQKQRPPEEIARLLQINSDQEVTNIKRWRTGNNEPFCIMNNYILSYLVPNLEQVGLLNESLYQTLEKRYNIEFGKAEDIVEAKGANQEESSFLGIEEGAPILGITRISYDPNDKPFEVVKQSTRSDLYRYKVKLIGRPD